MLAVAIHAPGKGIAVTRSKFEAGLHRAADAQVIGQAQDHGAGRLGHVRGAIGRTIVNHEDRSCGQAPRPIIGMGRQNTLHHMRDASRCEARLNKLVRLAQRASQPRSAA